jgi:hypothetical protein
MHSRYWQNNIGWRQGDMGLNIGSVVFIKPPVKDKDGNIIRKGSAYEISWKDYMEDRLKKEFRF